MKCMKQDAVHCQEASRERKRQPGWAKHAAWCSILQLTVPTNAWSTSNGAIAQSELSGG